MAEDEELLHVVLLRKNEEQNGFGFSVLGKPGLPPIIYNILEDSPAADSGEVEVGDAILKINETDVNRLSTKEVLKCLRLSSDPVTLKIKRDPKIKATVRSHLLSLNSETTSQQHHHGNHNQTSEQPTVHQQQHQKNYRAKNGGDSPSPTPTPPAQHHRFSPSSVEQQEQSLYKQQEKRQIFDSSCQQQQSDDDVSAAKKMAPQPKFEAYMMTGEHILNISRMPRTSSIVPKQQKKIDSSRYHNSHTYHLHDQQQQQLSQGQYYQHKQHNFNSVPNSPNELDLGYKKINHGGGSHLNPSNHHGGSHQQQQKSNSLTTSPILSGAGGNHGNNSSAEFLHGSGGVGDSSGVAMATAMPNQFYNNAMATGGGSYGNYVRTSRSEDQLQGQLLLQDGDYGFGGNGSGSGGNGGGGMNAMDTYDVDEDMTSSLNTLLDTRIDGGGSGGSAATTTTGGDRIIWTYNAPVSLDHHQQQQRHKQICQTVSNGNSNSSSAGSSSNHSNSSPTSFSNVSPLHSSYGGSPVSPTSVSSSIMSSQSAAAGAAGNSAAFSSRNSNNNRSAGAGNTAANINRHSNGGSADCYHGQSAQGHNSGGNNQNKDGGDFSQSECCTNNTLSNISSPDYHDDEENSLHRDLVMEIYSDPSDSDSTLLVSDYNNGGRKQKTKSAKKQNAKQAQAGGDFDASNTDHKIVIQVKGPNAAGGSTTTGTNDSLRQNLTRGGGNNNRFCCGGDYVQQNREQTSSCNNETMGENEDFSHLYQQQQQQYYPSSTEDDSDVESLHSFHYSPKAVDLPSAIRLAKRLYSLDGFKKSDVSRHLSKNNDFSKAVAEEYLKYFNFESDTLDISLRKFLKQFCLTGETQERERVLVHFSKRYLDCNPGSFNSQDAVHTLTCAIMLLNTDLHGQNVNRKMTCNEFIENLAGLNESENFPREVLKQLYHAIKNYPLEWALDEDLEENMGQSSKKKNNEQHHNLIGNPFLDIPVSSNATEYKKGYVMRKCCYEANAKRTPFHKRNWKMFYCTVRDLMMYLHKDETGFRKNQMAGDNLHNAIRIHHGLATKATDYTKKQYVFRLQTADQAEYLFQTSDSKELQSWIDTINFVCATFSAPPLEAAVGSQKKFQRPLLPCSHTKLNMREQLRDHEERVMRLEQELEEHRNNPPEKNAKSLVVQNFKEKEAYLVYEIKRYGTYAYMLRSRLAQQQQQQHQHNLLQSDNIISLVVENSIGEDDESQVAFSAQSGGNTGCPKNLASASQYRHENGDKEASFGGETNEQREETQHSPLLSQGGSKIKMAAGNYDEQIVTSSSAAVTNRYSYRQAIYQQQQQQSDSLKIFTQMSNVSNHFQNGGSSASNASNNASGSGGGVGGSSSGFGGGG